MLRTVASKLSCSGVSKMCMKNAPRAGCFMYKKNDWRCGKNSLLLVSETTSALLFSASAKNLSKWSWK